MVETIAPVVYGKKSNYFAALGLHTFAAAIAGAVFGALLSGAGVLLGAPWGVAGAVAVSIGALAYSSRELLGVPLPLFDRRRQVPDWWRTFYSPPVAATLYGAGLGIGFLTFLGFGTYVVVSVMAFVSGEVWIGAVLGGTFGLARGLGAVASSRSNDAPGAAAVVSRLEHIAQGRGPRIVNGAVLLGLAAASMFFGN